MNLHEIFNAIKDGYINPEDAKQELEKIKAAPHCLFAQSKKEYSLIPSSSRYHDKVDNKDKVLNYYADKNNHLLNDTSLGLKPENLGNPVFRERYRCKWNYFAGSMYRGIASEQLVITMGKANLLSFFGSAGFGVKELETYLYRIQSLLSPDKPYGTCLISNLDYPEEEKQHAELFVKYNIPVIEAAAYSSLTLPLVYCRVKGLYQSGDKIIFPRRIIAKCSRMEIAQLFLSPPPIDIVNCLFVSGMINEEEAKLSQYIPMADDLAVEADSGGHTDQGVSFSLVPSLILLKEKMKQKYNYQQEILIGCGGGIGTPEAVAAAFMLGADFIFTGSINQCTVESGANDVIKELLNTISIHDTAITIAGDMFEIGAKVQVVKKDTHFHIRANKLYQLFLQYNSVEEIPQVTKQQIETQYFKRTFSEVWDLICEYKSEKNPEQITEAKENPRLKMALIFKWFFAHCNQLTLNGDESEKDNFLIFCGPALGSFNQWVQGTQYEYWKNRHVDKIAELLMVDACKYICAKEFFENNIPQRKLAEIADDSSQSTELLAARKGISLEHDSSLIAVIGISGQFPKSNNLSEFWDNLACGKNCISEIPELRWCTEQYYDSDPKVSGKTYCKWMGVLEDADKFDPLFFNISPAEAELMDPQQRVFLENCWRCIEDSGLNPTMLSGSSCGVFVGCMTSDYGYSLDKARLNAQSLMGRATSILAARISYLLNLKGPSLAIETACSSSLVAIAEACNSLKLHTSDLALAGGVCVIAGPAMHIMTSKAGMLSPDGRCFSFDMRANGFVPGEGVGVVLLKRLADALRDQNQIYGVIRGWGINQDGKTNGITAPSVNSQILLEQELYQRFNINPETISLVEAHGTGTKLGDPIEVEALTESFRFFTNKKNYCALGSVKSNIGHLLTAAGAAGVIKVLLALRHRMLPPTIHYETLNEHISLDNSPFYINTKLKPWEVASGTPRRAAVSSFGFSGTNAHIVIEEYLPDAESGRTQVTINTSNPGIFVLSAKSREQLTAYADLLYKFVEKSEDINLVDMVYTLQVGREAMEYRLAFLADSRAAALKTLAGFLYNDPVSGVLTDQVKKSKDRVEIFEADEDAKVLLHTWIQKGKLQKIAELWVKGLNIDWNELYGEPKPRRISLPTYPFARGSYWLSSTEAKPAGSTITNPAVTAVTHFQLEQNTAVIAGKMQTASTAAVTSPETVGGPLDGTVMLTPVWDSVSLKRGQPYPLPTDKVVFIEATQDHSNVIKQYYPQAHPLRIDFHDTIDAITNKLKSCGLIDHILWIASHHYLESLTDSMLIEEQNQGVLQVFRIIKALLRLGYDTRKLGWTLITVQTQPIDKSDIVNPAHASVHGLVGSMAKEYPNWKVRVIDLDANCDWPLADIFTLPSDTQGNSWVYRRREWYRQKLIPVSHTPIHKTPYKPGGVYVVIGGAGGIGEAWSEYMIRSCQAQIVWLGRRKQDAVIQGKLDRLGALGPKPCYITADAADQQALQQAYEEIKQRYSNINGVIHSAIVLLDKSLANMDEERFRAGLAAKVDVSVCLAQVFQKEPLDFVLFFSSVNSFAKYPGQSNYVAGCTFEDAFAHQLCREWPCAVKVMNWGYWGSVGVVASKVYQERMVQAGIGSIEPPEAMEGLATLLAGPINQMALIKTTKTSVIDGIDQEDLMNVYQEGLSSIIPNIANEISQQHIQVEGLNSAGSQSAKELDELLTKLLWCQLQSIGLFTEKNLVIADVKTKIGLRDLYDRWLQESFAVLTRQNYLQYDGESCSVIDTTLMDADVVWEQWELKKCSWCENPDMQAQIVLVETTLRALPEILTGKRLATDVLFPHSSIEMVEGVYKRNSVAQYFNEVLADTLATYIKERINQDPSARIRILEIGAGTGGTSAIVFTRLQSYQDHIEEYCYTDISKAFLMQAEKEYSSQNPFLKYHLFNVAEPVAGQGISTDGYDIVIAANVLHATKNIRQTLRNTKAVLKNNGVVLLNEITGNSLFTHLTFGLLEGWWLYEDIGLRIPGCPGLYPQTWREILEGEGFNSIVFPAQGMHDWGQQIIVAVSDGVVRERQTLKLTATPAKRSRLSQWRKGIKTKVGVTDQMVEGHVKETIIEKLSETLKIDITAIDVEVSFADYGLDSITGGYFVQSINQTLMTELKTTNLFDYSSVKQLTAYVLANYKQELTNRLGQKEKQTDVDDNLMVDSQERQSVYFSPQPFLSKVTEAASKRKQEDSGETIPKDPIAIIGMSGRFAKSKTVGDLWEHLASGTDLVETVSRWDLAKCLSTETNYCKHGSFLEDIDKFDPLFFNISGVEATYMDPQQRIFLEESWKALEDAGYAGSGISGRLCGVYVGYNVGDYQQLTGYQSPAQAMWGNASSVIPARIAYYLNLQGPAITVDTACSSSLVAIHLACQGLWGGETEMALAGGIFIQCTPWFYLSASRAGMLSSTGRCYTFDERADGFVPGEGAGAVVLKRLKDAITDGDHIYGVIRGSGINQDGTTNGITAPSANSQERLERYVYDTFKVHPEQIQMVEAHGTGTKLGDPIEYEALTRAFRKYTDKKEYCAIGTIKTNIGHTTAAAGVAGLIKILLSLQYKQIPPSLHFQTGNSNIRFEDSPFYVNTRLKEWNVVPSVKRCAAISAFGFSGTNAHMVIEEAPQVERLHGEKPGYLIVLSARTFSQLQQQAIQLVEYCRQEPQVDCGNMSFTLLLGRKHFNHRLACIVHSQNELVTLLEKWLEKGKVLEIYVSEISETDQRKQPSLRRYGNQCIQNCQYADDASEYLENLYTVAELYAQGYELEFGQLFLNEQLSRISLPTYPFARERYWVPTACDEYTCIAAAASNIDITSADRETAEKRTMCILKKQWELCLGTPTRNLNRTIAILAADETRELASQLAKHFAKGVVLDFYDLSKQLEQPKQDWKEYDGFVDLLGCGKDKCESLEWIPWLQQLVEQGHKEGLTVLCVTKGLESYQNTDVNLSGASRAGLYRMLHSEYRHLRSRHMDADPLIDDQALARQIASEFLMDGEDSEICYRNGERYRAYLQELDEVGVGEKAFVFPEDHVLWITGGTRGLGYLCAQHFITQYGVKRLVLTGRETMPPKDQWDSYERQNTPVAQKIQAIRALEAQGAQVKVLSVSLTDEQAVQHSMQEIKDAMGPIGGIIHSAGIADFENPAFIRKSIDGIKRIFAPKVAGLEILYQNFIKEPLQFFILFSSVSAVIPTLASGQSDYAMANAYMDYFAEANSHTCPIISIQWPCWKETGMGRKVKSKAYQETGLLGHTNVEGLQLLDAILSGRKGPVVLPAVVNPDLWMPYQLMKRRLQESLEMNVQSGHPDTKERPQKVDNFIDSTQKWLIMLFSEELRIDPAKLEVDKQFQDYGMDSILLAQILRRMDQELKGIALEPSVIIEYPTIRSLADYLTQTYSEALNSLPFRETSGKQYTGEHIDNQSLATFPQKNGESLQGKEVYNSKRKIAVVGIACHFPDAVNINDFWGNLKSGRDSIREVPMSRWDWNQYYDASGYVEGKSVNKWGAFLEGIEEFDPGYFKISETLAPQIDPLQRQWLEVSVEALTDAGYEKTDLWGRNVGIFVGARTGNFAYKLGGTDKNRIVGVGQNFIAAHLAHLYNFKGPNMVVDTACSSSLTAIHLAVKSIQNGEAIVALAGGVDILLDESVFIALSAAKVLSPDGRCKTFDAAANGIGLGEGCGVLVLQTLEQAIIEGRKIYGIIDGSAINHDGDTMGVTTPNPQAQYELIQSALSDGMVQAQSISYVETHGTGTLIGDPIELKALTKIFHNETDKKQFCGVGSVKSNIGHLLSAAGTASIIKVLLSMIHGQMVPTLHCKEPNPRFNFKDSPLYIVQETQTWHGINEVRRAGISAFGLGGNNAHIIVSDEGIPEALRATMKSRGQEVVFKKKRYWPFTDKKDLTDLNNLTSNFDQERKDKNDFMSFF